MAKKVVAGVDIGGTNTVFGLVDREGNILAEDRMKTFHYDEAEVFVAALYEKILLTGQKIGEEIEILGFGIGAPMGNINKGTIEYPADLPWKGIIPLADIFARHTSLPVIVTNDANAAAMGEMIFGGARGMKNFIVLTLGTGLGSGIVVDGKLVYGHTGFAGELGHMTVVPNGRECGCGRKVCFEAYGSATGLVKTVVELMSEMRDESPLRDIPVSKLTSKKIAEAAAKKDPIAVKAMQKTAEILGFGIINAVVFSSPEAIILFGGLANAGDALFEPVRKYADELVQPVFRGTFKIQPSGLPEAQAAILGSSALIWKELR